MSKIEWCDITINPVVGCSKCSPGCQHCYAEKMAYRLSLMPATAAKYAGVVDENGWTGSLNYDLSCLSKLPKKPSRIFVGSMTDIFHEKMDYDRVLDIVSVAAARKEHTFIFLTKRANAMKKFFTELRPSAPLKNIVLMATVENQQKANERIPELLSIPGEWKRGVSIEPMLGPVDLQAYTLPVCPTCERGVDNSNGNAESRWCQTCGNEQGIIGLDWVICGGETGPGARPMHPDWVWGLRDQCQLAGVPFFFKGWGGYIHRSQSKGISVGLYRSVFCDANAQPVKRGRPEFGAEEHQWFKAGKGATGRLLDGKEWSEVPG